MDFLNTLGMDRGSTKDFEDFLSFLDDQRVRDSDGLGADYFSDRDIADTAAAFERALTVFAGVGSRANALPA